MNFFYTHVNPDQWLLDQALSSGRLSEGSLVASFEAALAADLGLQNPVCTNSGTSALHLALILAGVKPGDEVILPPQTFVATGMAVLHCGAKPVFADINPNTGNLDYDHLFIKKLTDRTKAIIIVDWAGLPANRAEVARAAHGATLIVDAAHSLGAVYWHYVPVKHFIVHSFQSTKHLTTGDGGCICCPTIADAARARRLRWFGIDRHQEPGPLGERPMELTEKAWKYHLNDYSAALGLANLAGFKDRLAKRQANGAFLRKELKDVRGVRLLDSPPPDRTHAYYFFPLLVEYRRGDFARAVTSRGVPVSVVCSRIDKQPVFGGCQEGDLPGMDWFDARHIGLPCHEALTDDDLEQIVRSCRLGW